MIGLDWVTYGRRTMISIINFTVLAMLNEKVNEPYKIWLLIGERVGMKGLVLTFVFYDFIERVILIS